MNEISTFAPYVLYVITVLISIKVFARSDELPLMKAELLQYINENFVKENTYNANHEALQSEISQIRQDISEMKTLLINLSGNRSINN